MSQDAAEALFGLVALCQHLPHDAYDEHAGGSGGNDVEPSATLHSSLDVSPARTTDEAARAAAHTPEPSSLGDVVGRVRDLERSFLHHLACVELRVSQLPSEAETAAAKVHAPRSSATPPPRDCSPAEVGSPARIHTVSEATTATPRNEKDSRRGAAARRLAKEHSPQKAKQWFDQYTHKYSLPASAAPTRTALHHDVQPSVAVNSGAAEGVTPEKAHEAVPLAALVQDNQAKLSKAGTVRMYARQELDEAVWSWGSCIVQQAAMYDALQRLAPHNNNNHPSSSTQAAAVPHYVSPFALPAAPHTASQSATQGSQREVQQVLGALAHRTHCAHFALSQPVKCNSAEHMQAESKEEEGEEGGEKEEEDEEVSASLLPDAATPHRTSHSPLILPSMLQLRTAPHTNSAQPMCDALQTLQHGLLEALTSRSAKSATEDAQPRDMALQRVIDRLLRLQAPQAENQNSTSEESVLARPQVVGVVRRFTREAEEGTRDGDGVAVRLVPASDWVAGAAEHDVCGTAEGTCADKAETGTEGNNDVMRCNALLIEVTSSSFTNATNGECDAGQEKDEAALWDCLVRLAHFVYVIGERAHVTQTASYVAAALRRRRRARQSASEVKNKDTKAAPLITAAVPTSLLAFFFSLTASTAPEEEGGTVLAAADATPAHVTAPCSAESVQDDLEHWLVTELIARFRESASATHDTATQDESCTPVSSPPSPSRRGAAGKHSSGGGGGSVLLCRVQQLVPCMYLTSAAETREGGTAVSYASAVRYIVLRQLFFASRNDINNNRDDEPGHEKAGSPAGKHARHGSTPQASPTRPRARVAFSETPMSLSAQALQYDNDEDEDDEGEDEGVVSSVQQMLSGRVELSPGGSPVQHTSGATRHEVVVVAGRQQMSDTSTTPATAATSSAMQPGLLDTSPLTLTSPLHNNNNTTITTVSTNSAAAPRSILKSSARYKAAKLIRASCPAVSVVPFSSTTLWRCWLAEQLQDTDTAAAEQRATPSDLLCGAVRDVLCVPFDRYAHAVEQCSVWLAAEAGAAAMTALVRAERSLAERVLGVHAARLAPAAAARQAAMLPGADEGDGTPHEEDEANAATCVSDSDVAPLEHMTLADLERVMAHVARCVSCHAFAALVDTRSVMDHGGSSDAGLSPPQPPLPLPLPLVAQLRLRLAFQRRAAAAQLQLASHAEYTKAVLRRLTRALAEVALERLCQPLQQHMQQTSYPSVGRVQHGDDEAARQTEADGCTTDAAAEAEEAEEDDGGRRQRAREGDALHDVRRVLELCDALVQQYASCLLLPCPFYTSHNAYSSHTKATAGLPSSSPPPLLLISPDSVLLSCGSSSSYPTPLRRSFHPLGYCRRAREDTQEATGALPYASSMSPELPEKGPAAHTMADGPQAQSYAPAGRVYEDENASTTRWASGTGAVAQPAMRRSVSASLLRNTFRASCTWNLPQQWLTGPTTFMASFTISERDLRAMSQRASSTGGESAWSASLPKTGNSNNNNNGNDDVAASEACNEGNDVAAHDEPHAEETACNEATHAMWCGIRESALVRPYTTCVKQELLAAYFVTNVLPYLWQRVAPTLHFTPCDVVGLRGHTAAGIGAKRKSLGTLVSDGPVCENNEAEEGEASKSTPSDMALHSTDLVQSSHDEAHKTHEEEEEEEEEEDDQQQPQPRQDDEAEEALPQTWSSCVQQIQHTLQEVLLLRDQLRRELRLSDLSHTQCNETAREAAMAGQKPGLVRSEAEATMCEILRLMRSLVARVPSFCVGEDHALDSGSRHDGDAGAMAGSTSSATPHITSRARRRTRPGQQPQRHRCYRHHNQPQPQQLLSKEMHTSELISLPGFLGVEHEFSQDDAFAAGGGGGGNAMGHYANGAAGAALRRSPSTTAHNTSYSVVASEVYSPLALPQRSGTTTYTVASVSTMTSFTPIATRTAALMQQSTSEMAALQPSLAALNAITYVDGPLHVAAGKRTGANAASMPNGAFVLHHHYGGNGLYPRDDSALTTPREDALEVSGRRANARIDRVGSFLSLAKTPSATQSDAATQTVSLDVLLKAYLADPATPRRLGSELANAAAALTTAAGAVCDDKDDAEDEDVLQPALPTLLETLPYAPTVAPAHSTCLAGGSQSSYASSSCLSAPTMQAYSHFGLSHAMPNLTTTTTTAAAQSANAAAANKAPSSPSASTLHRSNLLMSTQPPHTPGEGGPGGLAYASPTQPAIPALELPAAAAEEGKNEAEGAVAVHTPRQAMVAAHAQEEHDVPCTPPPAAAHAEEAEEGEEAHSTTEKQRQQQQEEEVTLPKPRHAANTPVRPSSDVPGSYTPYGYIASAEPTPQDTHSPAPVSPSTPQATSPEHAAAEAQKEVVNATQSPSRGIGADLNAAATNATVYASVKALQTAFLSTAPAHHDAAVAALAELQSCLSRTTHALRAAELRCSRAETALGLREQTISDLQARLERHTHIAEEACSVGMQTELRATHDKAVASETQGATRAHRAEAESQTTEAQLAVGGASREHSQHAVMVAHLQRRLARTNVQAQYGHRRSRSAICDGLRLCGARRDEARDIQRAHISDLQATLADTTRLLEEARRSASEWRMRCTQHELSLQGQLARRETQVQALEREREELRAGLDRAQAELRTRQATETEMQQAHNSNNNSGSSKDEAGSGVRVGEGKHKGQQKHAKTPHRSNAAQHTGLIDDSLGLRYELQLKERRIAGLQECVRQLQQTRSTDAETIRRLQHLLRVQQHQATGGTAGLSPLPTSVAVLSHSNTRPQHHSGTQAHMLNSASYDRRMNSNKISRYGSRLSRSAELTRDMPRMTATSPSAEERSAGTDGRASEATAASRRLSWREGSGSAECSSALAPTLSSVHDSRPLRSHRQVATYDSAGSMYVSRSVRARSCDDTAGHLTSPSQGTAATATRTTTVKKGSTEKTGEHDAAAPMSPDKYREEYAALSVSLSRLHRRGL